LKKTVPDSNESQMHLEAMLYLLEDPTLDRHAFETRLLEEPQLCEILANSVDAFLRLQSAKFESFPVRVVPETRQAAPDSGSFRWLFLPVIAASLFLACFVSWQAFVLTQANSSNHAPSVSSASSLSLNKIVLAWGDLQTDRDNAGLVQETNNSDLDSFLSLADSFAEAEVPDWLVQAAAETTDKSNPGDGKVFLQ
jgi:hypothetical protein